MEDACRNVIPQFLCHTKQSETANSCVVHLAKIILVQNAPEKPSAIPPSPTFVYSQSNRQPLSSQIVAHVEYNMPSTYSNSNNDMQLCYTFEEQQQKVKEETSSNSSLQKNDVELEDLCDKTPEKKQFHFIDGPSWPASLISSNREILALDIECHSTGTKSTCKDHSFKTENRVKKNNSVFISMPNLSASSENLLV